MQSVRMFYFCYPGTRWPSSLQRDYAILFQLCVIDNFIHTVRQIPPGMKTVKLDWITGNKSLLMSHTDSYSLTERVTQRNQYVTAAGHCTKHVTNILLKCPRCHFHFIFVALSAHCPVDTQTSASATAKLHLTWPQGRRAVRSFWDLTE